MLSGVKFITWSSNDCGTEAGSGSMFASLKSMYSNDVISPNREAKLCPDVEQSSITAIPEIVFPKTSATFCTVGQVTGVLITTNIEILTLSPLAFLWINASASGHSGLVIMSGFLRWIWEVKVSHHFLLTTGALLRSGIERKLPIVAKIWKTKSTCNNEAYWKLRICAFVNMKVSWSLQSRCETLLK